MKEAAFLLLCMAAVGYVQAYRMPKPPPLSLITPADFRRNTDYLEKPCSDENFRCLAHHLMYLQCGAILVEKMALEEGESPKWYAYSMHSGPKVSFAVAGYEILISFDPSLPAMWYTGEEFDPVAKIPASTSISAGSWWQPNKRLIEFIQQTEDWLDSQDWTITDACELQAFWKELRADSFHPLEASAASDDRSNPASTTE